MDFKTIALFVAITGALAGCGSSVKIQDGGATDSTASAISTQTTAPSVQVNGVCPNGGCSDQGVATLSPTKSAAANADADAEHGPNAIAHTIQFAFDSFEIAPQYESVLQAHAQYIRANKNATVVLEGHTDDRGSREYNLALGQKRAVAVQRTLGLFGADSQRMESVSYGEEKPVAVGSNEEAWAKNRRTEIRYTR